MLELCALVRISSADLVSLYVMSSKQTSTIKRPPRSKRELRFVEELATAPTAAAAARAAGYADPVQSAWELKQRLDISRCLNDAGVTPNILMETLASGLKATKRDRDGNELADHTVRHKFLVTALELHGFLAQADAGAKAVAIATTEEKPIRVNTLRYMHDSAIDIRTSEMLKNAEKIAADRGQELAERVVIIPMKDVDSF